MATAGVKLLLSLGLLDLTLGQTINSGGQTVAANSKNVAPAVATVTNTSSNAALFPYEEQQLTQAVLTNLTNLALTDISAFYFFEQSSATNTSCKAYPGDSDWPADTYWDVLNLLSGGQLIEAVPAAAVCYSDWAEYDETKCATVTADWDDPEFQRAQPVDVDYPLFEGVTCMPPSTQPTGQDCTLGGYPSYVMNVTNVAQIQLAFNFARNLNLRLVIKNKGHDFNSKSSGGGALSVWTNGLGDIEYLGADYSEGGYNGHAFKVGAGVSTLEIYEAADAQDLVVVSAIARTVGIAGGYNLGGGHSPMMGLYGLGGDQVLSMEVVLPDGHFVTVSEDSYPDLFFALRGGGGATWGIVTSMVIAAYPKTQVTTLVWSFATSSSVSNTTFWNGMDYVWATFPSFADAGLWSYWSLVASSASDVSFSGTVWANDMTSAQLKSNYYGALIQNLTALGITVTANYTTYDGLLNAWETTWPASSEVAGVWYYHTASRLFPRSNWESSTTLAKQSAVLKQSVLDYGMMMGYNFKAATNSILNQTNAANPAFRETLMHGLLGASWTVPNATHSDINTALEGLVEALEPWREITPGAYLNEADINEPDWQQSFYGDNYDYLYSLKQKYDPFGVLYAQTAVGSEDWEIEGQLEYYPTQNGKLCRV